MKRLLLLTFGILPSFVLSQHITNSLKEFDRTGMETSILYNNSGIVNIAEYDNYNHNKYSFLQAYKAISFSDFENRLLPYHTIHKYVSKQQMASTIELGLLFSDFETLKPEVQDLNIITKDANGIINRTNFETPIFNQHELLIISPIKAKHKGLSVIYNLPSNLIYNTSEAVIQSVLANFDDGEGQIEMNTNNTINVNYSEPGLKTLSFIVTLTNGRVLNTSSIIRI